MAQKGDGYNLNPSHTFCWYFETSIWKWAPVGLCCLYALCKEPASTSDNLRSLWWLSSDWKPHLDAPGLPKPWEESASTDFPCNLPKILITSQTKQQRVRETQSTWDFTTCLVQKAHTKPHCFIGFKKRRRMKNNKHLIVFLPKNLFFQKISLIVGFQQNYCSKLKLFSGPDCNFGSILYIFPEIRLIESWFFFFFFFPENIAHTVQLMTVWEKKPSKCHEHGTDNVTETTYFWYFVTLQCSTCKLNNAGFTCKSIKGKKWGTEYWKTSWVVIRSQKLRSTAQPMIVLICLGIWWHSRRLLSMSSHGREMRQNFNENISKLFVRQQMKDESWESTVQSQKKNVFSFWKTLLFLFSLASLSIPTSVPTYSAPIFSLGSIRQSLLQAQISVPSVFEGIHS